MTAPPREPTPEMMQACCDVAAEIVKTRPRPMGHEIAARYWRAMYDAAPEPPAEPPQGGILSHAFLRGYNRGLQHAEERATVAQPAEPPATDVGEVDKERRRAERAEAERDALREVVQAADAMRLGLDCPMCDSGKLRNPAKEHWDTCAFANYDAARAKVKP